MIVTLCSLAETKMNPLILLPVDNKKLEEKKKHFSCLQNQG
jgi:hypothetical protein